MLKDVLMHRAVMHAFECTCLPGTKAPVIALQMEFVTKARVSLHPVNHFLPR